MKLHIYLALALPLLASAHPFIVEHIETPYHRIQTHNDTIHVHEPRDGTSIEIKSSISNSSVNKTQNNANGKFGVINNAKSANVAIGDNPKHTADFYSFGHKKMLISTGSNTGGWNTKNHGKLWLPIRREKVQKPLARGGKERSEKIARYRKLRARQNKDGYRWDDNMRPMLHVANLLNVATLLSNMCLGRKLRPRRASWPHPIQAQIFHF